LQGSILKQQIISNSPEDTQRLGKRLGELAQVGDVFLLVGRLGTGKTCLTQGIARGLGIEGGATSPSFVIVKEYYGRLPLYHIDLYRLDQTEEVLELGLDEYLYGNGICVVEWAEKGLNVLPQEHLLIKLEHISENKRRLSFEPEGEHHLNLVSELCNWQ
jgi:tRNA threonylcarbamoyladenosine biosynthesis protein TsaE